MKKCKYCKTEIDKDAKICPNCRKKQRSKIWVVIGIFIIFIGIGSLFSNPQEETDDENQCYLTLDKFNQIETGMTYNEVSDLIGCEGTVSTDASVGDTNMKVYYWYAENGISNGTFSFIDDKLTSKSQIGLK